MIKGESYRACKKNAAHPHQVSITPASQERHHHGMTFVKVQAVRTSLIKVFLEVNGTISECQIFFLLEGNVNMNSLAKFQVEKDKNRRDIAGQNFVSKADLAGKI